MKKKMTSDVKPVLTKAALRLQNNNKDFQVLTFEEPKRIILNHTSFEKVGHRQNDNAKHSVGNPPTNMDQQEFDIRTARRDVIKFAMNNQRTEKQKKKMMIYEMARMGFKGPKKPYKNYKVLLKERKHAKEMREQCRKFHQLGKTQTGLAAIKCKSKSNLEKRQKKRPPVTSIDKHYGTIVE